jgi:hypothetical protein
MKITAWDLDYDLTPVASKTMLGRTDVKFVCNECDYETLLIDDGKLSYMQDVRAHDHYLGECPVWRLNPPS